MARINALKNTSGEPQPSIRGSGGRLKGNQISSSAVRIIKESISHDGVWVHPPSLHFRIGKQHVSARSFQPPLLFIVANKTKDPVAWETIFRGHALKGPPTQSDESISRRGQQD